MSIQGWAKIWNTFSYSETIDNNASKLSKITIRIVVNVSVFRKGRPVKEAVRIFIEAYGRVKVYVSRTQQCKPDCGSVMPLSHLTIQLLSTMYSE